MSNLHPIFEEILSTTIRQATEPRVTRIEFAAGHENERLTDEGVAGKLRLMKAAGQMYEALKHIVDTADSEAASGGEMYYAEALSPAVEAARAALAAADGQEPA
jgi:hypothetical protein